MAQVIQLHPREYKNNDAIIRVIEYITRTRENETKADQLICWGDHAGCHHGKTPAQTIAEYEYPHRIFHKTGSKLLHFSIRLLPSEFQRMNFDFERLANYAIHCCQYIFSMGYQCCFAIHCTDEPDIHIHLVMNSVSYQDDHKFSQYHKRVYNLIEKPLLDLFYQHLYTYPFMDNALSEYRMPNYSS